MNRGSNRHVSEQRGVPARSRGSASAGSSKVPANLTTPESRAQYQEIMQQPMQVYPGSQLTVSKIKSVRESQEKAKADAARLGDDSLTVDPNLKDFQNVTEDNGNEPVFLLTNGEGTTVVRQQGVNYFDTSGNRIPVDLKTQKLEPLVVSAAGKYVAVGQHTQELLVTSIHGGLYDWIGLGIKAEIFPAHHLSGRRSPDGLRPAACRSAHPASGRSGPGGRSRHVLHGPVHGVHPE